MTREVNCGCLFGQTCRACADVDPRKMSRRPKPIERRATVSEGETRLALLERLLGDVTAKWDTWRSSLNDGHGRFAEDNAWEALGAAIEAARAATGGGK